MIEKLSIDNYEECAKLANLLWPDNEYQELANNFKDIINSDKETCFLYFNIESKKEYIGFLQVSLRFDYVEGSNSSPVTYIEGIYVVDEYRRIGIAHTLVNVAKEWGKEKGCSEIASDCELSNQLSIDFHKSIGFEEANRLVCFIKTI